MRRREFITLVGGAAAWPLAARAQQAERVRKVGVLINSTATPEQRANLAAFQQTLQQLGWTVGRGDLLPARIRRRRRLDLLRLRCPRSVQAFGRLRRSHPQGREAGRPAGAGSDQIRTGDQPQDRQGARARGADIDFAARHRSDRIAPFFAALHVSVPGTNRCAGMSAFAPLLAQ
jgi:hypothetical protein